LTNDHKRENRQYPVKTTIISIETSQNREMSAIFQKTGNNTILFIEECLICPHLTNSEG
jgi:hypothetical protein